MAKIGFTGSTEVGRGVMQGAAATIKRVTLELGGKSANVVFADADLERAAAAAPYAVFDNAGQDCCARSRILVERSAYDRFLELLVDGDAEVKVGDPSREETEMGPLISAAHRETVASFVDGEPLFRGETPDGPGLLVPVHARRGLERRPHRARGGLRPGRGGDPVRRRGRRDPDRERHAVRPLRVDLDPRRRPRDPRRAGARDRRPLGQLEQLGARRRRRSAASSSPGFGRELGMQAMEGYSEIKNVFFSTEAET